MNSPSKRRSRAASPEQQAPMLLDIWGDTVSRRDLVRAIAITIPLGLGFYLIGKQI